MGEWIKLEEHQGNKYEFRHNGVRLGTIFGKPSNGKWSVWFCTPIVVRVTTSFQTKSYEASTLDEAKELFDSLLRGRCLEWATTVVDYLDANQNNMREALESLYALVQHETNLPECAANGVTSDAGDDEGIGRAGMILEQSRIALLSESKNDGSN